MGVSLTKVPKGGNVSLTKAVADAGGGTLSSVNVGLGWDARTTSGQAFDLDGCAIVLGADGKVLSDQHFVFFNNLKTPDGTVEHSGDNLTGEGEGADETIKVNLAGLPPEADKVVFPVAIFNADSEGQTFGQVRNGFIEIANGDTGEAIARYDLTEDASLDKCMVFGEVYRNGADWKFKAIGQGHPELAGLARDYGVNV